jgi:hypothetical protein
MLGRGRVKGYPGLDINTALAGGSTEVVIVVMNLVWGRESVPDNRRLV